MTRHYKYRAFISYSHQDEAWASWLHDQLEGYQPPVDLNVPGKLSPVFQDTEELAASRDLSRTIEEALAVSENLIVICSPAAAASQWVKTEIEEFIALGRDEQIFCLVVDGTPNDPRAECLPQPLRAREPLAVDVRTVGHSRGNALLKLYAGLLGVDFNALRRREVSIAVLPFRDLSPSGDKEYLSDGIAEELLNHLTQLRDLRVISRTSSFQFRASDLSASEIGQRLDATYVAEGSIRTLGSALRVSVQLVDARTDASLWSKTYDRDLSDVFVLQDEIAADVAGELHQTVTHQARQAVSADAYQLALRAKHLAKQFTKDALQRSNELFREAIALEPDYTDAWNCLSANYCTQVGEGFLPLAALQDARDGIAKVLAIDPDDVEALSSLAWLMLRFDNDLPAAAGFLQRALAREPNNVPVLNSVGGLLVRLRRPAEALVVAKQVAKLDPLNSFAFANLGVYSLFAGELDAAIAAYETALEISPGFVGAHFAIGLALLLRGEPDAALVAMEREPDEEFCTKGKAFVHFSRGDTEAFERALGHLIESWGDEWPSEVAEVYAWAGRADEAFEWIDKDADNDHGAGWAESVVNPVYQKLHNDPRWIPFLEGFGLAPAQLVRIEFVLPDGLQVSG